MAWSAWPEADVTVSGATKTTRQCAETHRVTCASCGGKVMGIKPEAGVNVLFPAMLAASGAPFQPVGHMFYDERLMDVDDGVPKFVDKPEALGGTGRLSEGPPRSLSDPVELPAAS